jgi:uncharacterized cupredoxin-like copper-binding protein
VRLLALAAAGVFLLVPGSAQARRSLEPARLQVVAHEFTLTLSRQSILAGPAVIELVNMGMDPHDLRLQRIGGTRVYATKKVGPGGRSELDVKRLLPGRYRVWCSILDHRMRGMRATLSVVARKHA